MKILFTSLPLIVLFFRVAAQDSFEEPSSQELTTIKFIQFTGGVICFKALLDDKKDSLLFILDTGSGGISLDSTTVRELGIEPPAPERLVRGVGGVQKVGVLKNRKLTVNGLEIDSLNFHVVDYEILSALYGEKIDGIVGYAVLSRFILKIDYEKQEITFCSNGSIKYPRGGYLLQPQLNTLPYLQSQVKDHVKRQFYYLYDIGAGLTVLFSKKYMEDSTFLKKKRRKYLKQGEGLGGKVDMYISVMKKLRIGPYKFRYVPLNIFDDTHNITSYPTYGGLIGNDIFRRFNCILNYNKKEIYITPNKFFRDPFDYAYSGLELYLIDGRPIIGDIPNGSPADRAGLKAGDEVIAVNNRFGMTLNEMKQMLQSTYGIINILIRRNNELQMKKMKIINILNGKYISNQSIPNTFREKIRIKSGSDLYTTPPLE